MSTVDRTSYVDFYDLLNALDWTDPALVLKTKKQAQLTLEHKVLFVQFQNHHANGAQKPERPTL